MASERQRSESASLSNNLAIEVVSIEALKPNPCNPRTHSKSQVATLARSIDQFDQVHAIITDDAFNIIGGHAILQALSLLGRRTARVVRIGNLNEHDKKALAIGLNRIAEEAGWDRDLLALGIQELVDAEYDLELTGFDIPQIDIILEEYRVKSAEEPEPEDDLPAIAADRPATAKLGDLWLLNEHKLFVGDARNAAPYQALLGVEQADMIITDPPYNVKISGVVGRGRTKYREFAMASGEMTRPQFTRFLAAAFQQMAGHSKDGALAFIFSDAKHLPEMLTAGETAFDALQTVLVWDKGSGGMGGIYRNQHEHVLLQKIGKAPHVNNVQLGRHGRTRTTVWRYRGLASFGKDRLKDLESHPTVKPAAMLADAILDVTRRNEIVLDPFAGSGSTVIAAEKTGRRARVIEIDPYYADVIVRRWESYSGKAATYAATGLTFEEMADQRGELPI